jgi:hypothetical protein
MLVLLFSYEYLDFDNFSDFQIYKTFMRIFMPMLSVMQMHGEMKTASKMLTFLKRQRGLVGNERGRFINIGLASMQILAPIATIVSIVINITQ